MKAFILGTIFGIVLCTVGLSGIARMFDNGVSKVQQVTKEASQ
jgi:flagellar biosynthesis protein FliR